MVVRDRFRHQRGRLLILSGALTNHQVISIVYPVARTLPVIFIALADVLRGRYLTTAGWVGVLLVAFRQFSIVIGAALAFMIFKEHGIAVRLSGAVMISIGLVLIATLG